MKQEKKLLFFDIDGTLAMPGDAPTETVVNAMRSARSRGHLLILSTGRTAMSVPPAVEAIAFDGYIYSAGGRTVAEGQELYVHTMEPSRAAKIIEVVNSTEGVFATLECAHGSYHTDTKRLNLEKLGSDGGSTELRRIVQLMAASPEWSLNRYAGEPIFKISFFCTSRQSLNALTQRLNPLGKVVVFDNLLTESAAFAGEITGPGTDKGRALREICAYFGAETSQSVAFGDSMNDAEMLLAAGVGVAMGNAERRVKDLADRVCESCDEDGVAKELKRMGLC